MKYKKSEKQTHKKIYRCSICYKKMTDAEAKFYWCPLCLNKYSKDYN